MHMKLIVTQKRPSVKKKTQRSPHRNITKKFAQDQKKCVYQNVLYIFIH